MAKDINYEPKAGTNQVTNTGKESSTVGNNDRSRLVQMRLQPKTLESIEDLRMLTRTENRTQIVSSAIQLTAELLSSLKQGAKIYIEKPNGKKELIKFIGL
jgi:hypothetical protein